MDTIEHWRFTTVLSLPHWQLDDFSPRHRHFFRWVRTCCNQQRHLANTQSNHVIPMYRPCPPKQRFVFHKLPPIDLIIDTTLYNFPNQDPNRTLVVTANPSTLPPQSSKKRQQNSFGPSKSTFSSKIVD